MLNKEEILDLVCYVSYKLLKESVKDMACTIFGLTK